MAMFPMTFSIPTLPVSVGLEDRSRRVVEDGFRGTKLDSAVRQERKSRRKRREAIGLLVGWFVVGLILSIF